MAVDPRQLGRTQSGTPRADVGQPLGVQNPVTGATAAEMSGRRFGGPTRVNRSTVTLTTAVQTILNSNPRRVFWQVINRGVVNAGVDIDPSASFAQSILMGAAGGFVQSDVTEDGETVAWPVYGVCESGTCVVMIYEVVRV